jgi:hypothetical protein
MDLFLVVARFAKPALSSLNEDLGFAINFNVSNAKASRETVRSSIFYKRDFLTGENFAFMNPLRAAHFLTSYQANVGNTEPGDRGAKSRQMQKQPRYVLELEPEYLAAGSGERYWIVDTTISGPERKVGLVDKWEGEQEIARLNHLHSLKGRFFGQTWRR